MLDALKKLLILIACFLSTLVFSGTLGKRTANTTNSWSFTASLGYDRYQNVVSSQAGTPIARLALGKQFFVYRQMAFGLEVGVQNGNTMDLDVPEETLLVYQGMFGGNPNFTSRVQSFNDFEVTPQA